MNYTVQFGENLNLYGIALFCVLGYFNGYLFRNPGLYKIIAIIFVVPFSLSLVSGVNLVFQATIPFLLVALIGFLGFEKFKYYLDEVFYLVKGLLQRSR